MLGDRREGCDQQRGKVLIAVTLVSQKRIPILAYHALIADKRRSLPDGWSAKHAVRLEAFYSQISCLRADGWTSLLPEDLCGKPIDNANRCFVVTFDDGHDSDALAAAILHENGYRGIFYVPWLHIERPGFLTRRQILDLTAENFAIGSHGITHSPLTEKSQPELHRELALSKQHLESLIGTTVADLAIPFGRYNRAVIATAKAVGYQRIMTSDIGIARAGASAVFPRIPITASTTLAEFRAMVSMSVMETMLYRVSTAVSHRFAVLGKANPLDA